MKTSMCAYDVLTQQSFREALRSAAIAILAAVGLTTSAEASQSREAETIILPLSGMGEPGEEPVYWDFRIDAGRRAGEWTQIRVPSNWEQEGFGTYFYGTQGQRLPDEHPSIPKETGEYRTQFTVPVQWRGRRIRIVFDGAMTDTHVTVNGRSAGNVHQGGFYRFDYDITKLVEYGARNTLEVRVRNESSNTSVNRAERRADYWTFGGIYRPVWLEARPAHHIEWTAIDARADGAFYAQVHFNEPPPVGSTLRAQIYDASGQAMGDPIAVPLASGAMAVVRTRVRQPKAWSAEQPNLYRIRFELRGPEAMAALHETQEHFGFRTLEVRPRDGVYLNGNKIVLKGINRHSFRPATGRTLTRADSYDDAKLMKEANMNAVRMAHYPPDKHFLQAADELGLYVLHELAGWQGSYDTPTAARLIGQLVRRDVNHPSVLFWNNGNEGGWNREVDSEFDRWDPQRRPVLHPWAIHSGINTDHYESYDSTVKLSAGPDIFMPTEFLHGLYDGGIGAGLDDYWRVMKASPTVAGGFFWAFADESIERTDRDRKLDSMGNAAPDGMLGPHGEKEGSYFTVKEIWSPVQIEDLRIEAGRSALTMSIRNDYSFTDLSGHAFTWRTIRLPRAGEANVERAILRSGSVSGPKLQPGENGPWRISLPKGTLDAYDVLHLTANDANGRELWTWSLPRERVQRTPNVDAASKLARSARTSVTAPPYTLTFDSHTGRLVELRNGEKLYPLANGPRLAAYRRKDRQFEPIEDSARLIELRVAPSDSSGTVLATATYDGALRQITWSRDGDGLLLSYELAHEGLVDILGIQFELPESNIRRKRWVGHGPYRVWQNRLKGGVFDLHETAFNDPVPGETYAYPEYKGYFGDWRWLEVETLSGSIVVERVTGAPYFGLHKPHGGTSPVLELPDVGLAFLSVIPAMGTKFDEPTALGPQSQPKNVAGVERGAVRLRFQ